MSALQMIEELLLIYFGDIHWIGVEANFPGTGADKKPTNLIKHLSRPTQRTTGHLSLNHITLLLQTDIPYSCLWLQKVPDLF